MVEITQELLKEHFEYRDGHLWWIQKSSPQSSTKVGQQFGSSITLSYRQGCFRGKRYSEHHLVWLYHYGALPTKLIDHINGICDDNRIENLREANNTQNQYNRMSNKNSSSKYKGVSWDKSTNKWMAKARFNGKYKFLGRYEIEHEAAEAYRIATENLHQEYKNYG